MQRFGSHHVKGSQTLLRSAQNHFHTTIPLICDRASRKRLVVIRSEVLRQFVNTMTAVYNYLSLESGEFTATTSNADISKTKNLFRIFYCLSGIYVKFRVF